MTTATHRAVGILLSLVSHGLIMLIPISLTVTKPPSLPPVELVMTMAERPLLPEPPRPPERRPPARPQKKVPPQPRPQPVITAPVETTTFMPTRVAAAPPPPPPNPTPAGPLVTEFGSATGPAFLRRVMPVYPEQARRLGREGKVVLRLHLDERGNLLKVDVVQSAGFGLDESALQAVKNSSFRPATIGGKPVACIARLPIKFVLRH